MAMASKAKVARTTTVLMGQRRFISIAFSIVVFKPVLMWFIMSRGELPWLLGFHFVVTTMLPLFAGSPNAVPTIDGSGDCSPCRRFMMG